MSFLLWLCSGFLYYSGVLAVYGHATRRARCRRTTVLTYHRVADTRLRLAVGAVSPRRFEQHMEYLTKRYAILRLDKIGSALPRDMQRPPLAVTFDDGYADNYTDAFPVMAKRGIPCTFFIVANAMGKRSFLWSDKFEQALLAARAEGLAIQLRGAGDAVHFVALPHKQGIRRFTKTTRRLIANLKDLPDDAKNALLDSLVAKLDAALSRVSTDGEMMTWGQIRELAQSGMEIGAHTTNHPILTKIDPDRANTEIAGSKEIIERELGIEVTSFAYPNGTWGDFNNGIAGMVRAAGFERACSTVPGRNGPDTDPYALRRVAIGDYPLCVFAARVSGILDPICAVNRWWRWLCKRR